jgi:hypothetical protein
MYFEISAIDCIFNIHSLSICNLQFLLIRGVRECKKITCVHALACILVHSVHTYVREAKFTYYCKLSDTKDYN